MQTLKNIAMANGMECKSDDYTIVVNVFVTTINI